MQGARRRPWRALRPRRATPQTHVSRPTLRDRADFASSVVVASSLGVDPTTSAPPRLKRNLPRSRPRGLLRQAPSTEAPFELQRERTHGGLLDGGHRQARYLRQALEAAACVFVTGRDRPVESLPVEQIDVRERRL